jgi:hypothetical protein
VSNDLYPEHEKLAAISDQSQTIGEFLDFGLGKLDLVLYERIVRDCECKGCKRGEQDGWHTESELAARVDGKVQITEYQPTRKTIKAILAEHFGIDQDAIDREKEEMLKRMRGEEP